MTPSKKAIEAAIATLPMNDIMNGDTTKPVNEQEMSAALSAAYAIDKAKTKIQPILVAGVCLLSKSREVLLGLRSDCLLWELAGGKVEDETIEQAGRRELLEETGIVAKGPSMFLGFVEEYGANDLDKQRFLTACLIWREWDGFPRRVEEDKCLAWRWYPVDELPPLNCCTPGTGKFLSGLLPIALKLFPEEAPEQESIPNA